MTREKLNKIAKRYAQDELKDNHSAVEDVVAAAFLNGIDYAENHPCWISVEDELPRCGLESRLQDYWQGVREHAAIAAMQGILCAPIVEGIDPNPSKEHIAELAVAQADALIEELKKK